MFNHIVFFVGVNNFHRFDINISMLPIQTLRRAKKLVATLGGKNKIYFKKSCYFSLCFCCVLYFFLIWQIICGFDKWKIWACCCFIQNLRSLALLSESQHFLTESEISHWNCRKTGASFALNNAFSKEEDIVFFRWCRGSKISRITRGNCGLVAWLV